MKFVVIAVSMFTAILLAGSWASADPTTASDVHVSVDLGDSEFVDDGFEITASGSNPCRCGGYWDTHHKSWVCYQCRSNSGSGGGNSGGNKGTGETQTGCDKINQTKR